MQLSRLTSLPSPKSNLQFFSAKEISTWATPIIIKESFKQLMTLLNITSRKKVDNSHCRTIHHSKSEDCAHIDVVDQSALIQGTQKRLAIATLD